MTGSIIYNTKDKTFWVVMSTAGETLYCAAMQVTGSIINISAPVIPLPQDQVWLVGDEWQLCLIVFSFTDLPKIMHACGYTIRFDKSMAPGNDILRTHIDMPAQCRAN